MSGYDLPEWLDHDIVHHWADVASITTLLLAAIGTILGVWGYLLYLWDIRRKRRMLEAYLKGEVEDEERRLWDYGRRSPMRITSAIGLTTDEIIQASFRSKCIERWALPDPVTKLTVGILFRYKILNDPSPPPADEPWKL
jgi:hypothetical protein